MAETEERIFVARQIEKMKNYENPGNGDIVEPPTNDSYEISRMKETLENLFQCLTNQTDYVLIGLYVPIIPIAIVANILVIVVILKNDYKRSATNYFVVNLSMADLLVTTMCMPMAISQAVTITWFYGEIMCKLFYYLQGVVVAASVFTITAMSIDRYLAIRKPIAFRRIFNRKSTIVIIVGIWILSLSIFAPLLKAVTLHHLGKDNITLGVPGTNHVEIYKPPSIFICKEDLKILGDDGHLLGVIFFVLVYAIPGFIMLVMYLLMGRTLYMRKSPFDSDSVKGSVSSQQGFKLIRERRRVAWILLTLAVFFSLCWLPFNILRLLADLRIIKDDDEWISDAFSYCLFLGHSNSMINPVVYCFMSRKFRRNITEICINRNDSTKLKFHHNTLPVAATTYSRRGGVHQRTHSNKTTSISIIDRSRGRTLGGCCQNTTTSTGCDSLSSSLSSNRRYKTISQRKRLRRPSEIKAEVAMKYRGSLNNVSNVRDRCRINHRSQSMNGISILQLQCNYSGDDLEIRNIQECPH